MILGPLRLDGRPSEARSAFEITTRSRGAARHADGSRNEPAIGLQVDPLWLAEFFSPDKGETS
jgi:hypothetical protein